jgi:phage major head subunit gpT-like protein
MPHKQRRTKRAQRREALRNAVAAGVAPMMLAEASAVHASIDLTSPVVIAQGVEAAGGEPRKLPTLQIDAYNGGPMMVSGYYRPVVIDLAGVSGTGRPIPVLRNHDADRIVGHGEASISGGAIKLTGKLSAENEDSTQITKLAANGFPWQASVGFQPTRLENVEAGATVKVNGIDVAGPAIVARTGKLYEVSIVPLGADDSTATHVAAQGAGNMAFEAWLKAKGWDFATLTDDQKTTLRAAFEASGFAGGAGGAGTGGAGGSNAGGGNAGGHNVSGGAGGGHGQVNAGDAGRRLDELLAESKRAEERHAKYAEIIAGAIDRGMGSEEARLLVESARESKMNVSDFELKVMRLERDLAPRNQLGGKGGVRETSQDVIECAIAQTANVTNFERLNADGSKTSVELYSAELMQRAKDQFPQGLTMMELMVKAARRSGYISDTFRMSKALMQAAFAPIMARGASTYDLSGVLSNVANKSIMAGFDAVENTWREVSAIGSVVDFKEITHYALTGNFVYEEVGNGGELKHATMGEQAYGNKADTYGKIFAITRTDFINDDLSAFSRVRNMLGRGAALKLNLVFWTEFLANVATFFTTGRGNYFEGATSALDVDSLSLAETTFMNQTDPDENPLGLTPSILLTPNVLSVKATQLTNDLEIRNTTASKVYTTSNPHAGKFRPVRSSYLNNANIPNGSATHWFLTADPNDMPLIETVFLNGQQRPMVDAAEADFDVLGVQMRGYHDFGVRKQEYRAGVRSKGAA